MSYFSQAGYQSEANEVVVDLYRPLTESDHDYPIQLPDGQWGIMVTNEYGVLTTGADAYEGEDVPTFATRELAERYLWFWIAEGEIVPERDYSMEAKALLEGLEGSDWSAGGRIFSSEAQAMIEDGSLDAYNEQLGRSMIRLFNGTEVCWFDTCVDAAMFLMDEDGVQDQCTDFYDRSEIALNEGTYVRYTLR